VQHACRIADATAIERHLDNLVFDVRGLAGVGIVEQEGASVAGFLPAAVALLAFRTFAVSDNIGPSTIWTVEYKRHHSPLSKKLIVLLLQSRVSDPQLYNIFQETMTNRGKGMAHMIQRPP
jgi:hypothetical protein